MAELRTVTQPYLLNGGQFLNFYPLQEAYFLGTTPFYENAANKAYI